MKKIILILLITSTFAVAAQGVESAIADINEVRAYYGLAPVEPHRQLTQVAIWQVQAMRSRGYYHAAYPEANAKKYLWPVQEFTKVDELINTVPAEWFAARQPATAYELLLESYEYSDVHYNRIMDPQTRYVGIYSEDQPQGGVLYSTVMTAEGR